jgi:hypothetical protein
VWLLIGSFLLLLLTAGQCGGAIDSRPVADAGSDLSVAVGDTVQLDGSGSVDPDGDPLAFTWSFESVPVGSAATLVLAGSAKPSFTADVVGAYVVLLEVFDGDASAFDSVTVAAENTLSNDAPIISTIADRAMVAGDASDVPIAIADENPDSVSVEPASDDQTLIADANIQVLGSGTDRVLRVTPAPLGAGQAVITVTVRDSQGLEDSESFRVTVTAPFEAGSLKLTASDAASGAEFGSSVAISGDHLIIGAPRSDDGGTDSGSAYIFRRSGDGWVQSVKLPPAPLVVASMTSSIAAVDLFGGSVAISGDYAIVGARGDDAGGTSAGAAYVYERCDSTFSLCDQPWREVGKLTASDAAEEDHFGVSVAISGDYAIVGARLNDLTGTDEGSAYVFKRSGDDWVEIQKLTASTAADHEGFGYSVAISENVAIVGTLRTFASNSTRASAYVFERSGDNWVEMNKLIAGDSGGVNLFGTSVAIYGDRALVGAHGDLLGGTNAGSAYAFKRGSVDWVETEKLTASDAAERDRFGYSVGLDQNYAVIGAYRDDVTGTDQGSAYVFRRVGDTWVELEKLTASDGAAGDHFGFAVAIGGEDVIVGALRDDLAGVDEGSAYVFPK